MGSPKLVINKYYRSKKEAVDAVAGLLPYLDGRSQLTMTIKAVRSGDYSVYIATDTSSDGTVPQMDITFS